MRLKPQRQAPDAVSILTGILLSVYVIGLFIPMLWTVMASITNVNEYFDFYVDQTSKTIPTNFTLENFTTALAHMHITAPGTQVTYNMIGLYINSLIYSISSAVAFTFCSSMVSYLTAKFDFKFSKIVYAFVIVAMSLPIVGSMPSEIQMLQNLGIYGQWISMPILRFNFLSVYFLVLYAQFKGISKEYSEAAKIDGASNLKIMLRIVMPQAINIVVTIFVLTFITYWNDYQIPRLYIRDYPVAAYGIFYFMNTPQGGGVTSQIPVQMAGTLLMTLPILLVVIIFNKRLRVSVSIGGIKG